jgi:hypothetical protein
VHDQSARTPSRTPGPVRRTTRIDTFRLRGPRGPSTVLATGRDLLTPPSGEPVELDAQTVRLTLTPVSNVITAIEGGDDLADLIGVSVSSGFRRALGQITPPAGRGALRHRMLDDLVGAVLVSGVALVEANAYPIEPRQMLVFADVCRGWATGGIQLDLVADGVHPMPTGPVPNDVSAPEDPWAWHRVEPLAEQDFMRRSRRIDVQRDGAEVVIDAHFRDESVPLDRPGQSIHEYSVFARADAATPALTDVQVTAHALPWQDCNSVPETAAHLIGLRLGELETTVRTKLAGTAGCTHLNDTYRGLDAVPLLAQALEVPR